MAEQGTPSSGSLELLQFLRDGKPKTRGRLADLTGVARSTAGIRIDELIGAGLVEESLDAVYTGGRPSTRVSLAARSRVVLAADIGATHARVALVDLLGQVLHDEARQLERDDEPDDVLRWLMDAARQMTETAGMNLADVAAVGVGLAAPIERLTGRPIDPPIMPRWRDLDLRERLMPYLDIPVLVEKDVNMMALGQLRHTSPPSENLLFAKIATGIGAGIISGGRLHRGEQGTAGDIGHVPIGRRGDAPCHCGNTGCLEAIASGPALARQLAEAGMPARTSQDVVDLVRAGDLYATQLVRQAGRDLGEVLATCVSLFNPSSIFIGGTLAGAGEQLLAGVRETIYARSMPIATQHLAISPADPAADSAIQGAAALAIDYVLMPR